METAELFPGDCLDPKTGILSLPPQSVDLVLTDLPYEATRQEWDSRLDMDTLWSQLEVAAKPTASYLFFCDLPLGLDLIRLRPDIYRYEYIWVKNKTTGFFNVNKRPLRGHEFILVFYRESPWYESVKSQGHRPVNYAKRGANTSVVYGGDKGALSGGNTDRHPSSVLCYDVVNNDSPERIHSNQKPDLLLQHLIRSHCPPGGLVLDVCAGSASALVAARACGRRSVGWEKDPENYQKAALRLAEKETDLANHLPGFEIAEEPPPASQSEMTL
jgi:DNA modification methylase